METENKDWKPEVGKTAWFMANDMIKQVLCIKDGKELLHNSFAAEVDGRNTWLRKSQLFPTPEAALASIKIYDLEGKEVVIPRAQDEIAMLKTELVVANAIIDNLSPRLEAALERILELQEEKEELEFEGGGASIGGKSDQREGGC